MNKLIGAVAALLWIGTAQAASLDTLLVTGPQFQQVFSADILVTPDGLGQTTLGAALAASGGGGIVGPPTTTLNFIPQWSNTFGNGLGTGLPVGLTGNSTILQTTSGGLLAPSVLPLATTAAFGAVKPDGSTITISAGVISSVGGGGGSGTVTSVNTTVPSFLTGTGCSYTTSGTCAITLATQSANTLFAGPATGAAAAPAFRSIVAADIPLATTGAFGAVKPDGSTITISAGVITAVAGGTGCTVSGAAGIVSNNGSSGCVTDTNAVLSAGALTLGASGTAGSVTLGNATTGTLQLVPATGALGTSVITFPAATADTVSYLGLAQSYTATKTGVPQVPAISTATFTPVANGGNNITITLVHASCPCTLANPSGTLVPGTSGMLRIVQSATGSDLIGTYGSDYVFIGGTPTLSAGASTATDLPYYVASASEIDVFSSASGGVSLSAAQTWIAAQTYTNSDFLLLGSSTGATTFSSANASATNYTATFAANTGTLAELNLKQSWTAPQRTNTVSPTISTTTFTPNFDTSQNIRIAFPATTCTCTIANPSTSLVAGQSGMFELVQGATSASLDPTWGSSYVYAGGTSTITLTTTLGGVDYIPYYVDSTATFIVLGGIILHPVH
jgi:hypothetical protein